MSTQSLDLAAVCADFQVVLESELGLSRASIPHPGVKGDVGEDRWLRVLREALPRRYDVAKAHVIDSNGAVSDQIDCVIFDPQYTPTLFNQEKHQFIAVEAVYAVLEAKTALDKQTLEYAGDKAASVRRLHRTSAEIPHAGGVYPPKPLFPIMAGVIAFEANWSDGLGRAFKRVLDSLSEAQQLDIGCVLKSGAFERQSEELVRVGAEAALMWFLFRLLARLQTLGTVPAIDWTRYSAALSS